MGALVPLPAGLLPGPLPTPHSTPPTPRPGSRPGSLPFTTLTVQKRGWGDPTEAQPPKCVWKLLWSLGAGRGALTPPGPQFLPGRPT